MYIYIYIHYICTNINRCISISGGVMFMRNPPFLPELLSSREGNQKPNPPLRTTLPGPPRK